MFDLKTLLPVSALHVLIFHLKIVLLVSGLFILLKIARTTSTWRHLSWLLLFCIIVLLPAFNTITPEWRVPIFKIEHQKLSEESYPSTQFVAKATNTITRESDVSSAAEPVPQFAPSGRLDWQNIFVSSTFWLLLWAAGFIFYHVRYATGQIRLAKIIKKSKHATDELSSALRKEIKRRFKIVSKINVLVSSDIQMPLAVGFFRFKIVLPADYAAWSRQHLKYVLLHETAHIKRRDMLSQFAIRLFTSIYWFNPVLWFAERQFAIEREHACDELVMRHAKNPGDYADMLLNFARSSLASPDMAYAGLAMARTSHFEGRLLAILNSTQKVQHSGVGLFKSIFILSVLAFPIISLSPYAVSADAENVDTTHTALVIESLKYALHDDDGDVREEAVKTLGKIKSEKATQLLFSALQEAHDWEVEVTAAKILLERGETRALEKFINGLSDDNRDQRCRAAKILKELAHPAALKPLIKAMDDEDSEVKEKVVNAICELRVPEAIKPLSQAMQDDDEDIRRLAAWGLGEIQDAKALPTLYAALNDPDAKVRCNAIESIGDIGLAESAQHVDIRLNDHEWFVRREAIKVLAEIRAIESAPEIIEALHDDNRRVREAAAEALGELGDRRAIVPLSAALHDKSDDVREAAADALGQFYKEK